MIEVREVLRRFCGGDGSRQHAGNRERPEDRCQVRGRGGG